jgi:hypothetical protein
LHLGSDPGLASRGFANSTWPEVDVESKEAPRIRRRFVLGRTSRDDVLVGACGTRDLEEAVRAAGVDVLKRRQLVNALFCLATRGREEGRERECLSLMKRCASLENPIVEHEWYLARGEIDRAQK